MFIWSEKIIDGPQPDFELITLESIREHMPPNIDQGLIYMCGPLSLTEFTMACFKQLGIAPERMHWERFGLV